MAMVSNPLFGDAAFYKDGNLKKWLTGEVAFGDISGMTEGTFQAPEQVAIDPGAYQMGDQWSQQYGDLAAQVQGRQAAQMEGAQIATGPQGEMRQGQVDLQNMLRARAEGTAGLSIAEKQLRQGLQSNQAGAASLAASQAGVNPAMALRGATGAQQAMGMQTNQQQAILRAQEILAAQQALGQQLGATRGQDIGLATGQAGFDQSAAQANLQASQTQSQANDAMTQAYMDQGLARDQAELAAAQEQERLKQEQAKLALETEKASAEDEAKSKGGFLGALGTIATAAVSDVGLKKNIKRGDVEIDDFMNSLAGYEYEYKDEAREAHPEETGKGKILSVMAQDMERTPLGKDMVEGHLGGSDSKGVNYGRGLGTMMASIARLNARLREVEGE